jgi:Na+/H+ antiporter NhaD/arsenite permease-like protein
VSAFHNFNLIINKMLSFFVLVLIFIVVIKLFKYIFIETHDIMNSKHKSNESNNWGFYLGVLYLLALFSFFFFKFVDEFKTKRYSKNCVH